VPRGPSPPTWPGWRPALGLGDVRVLEGDPAGDVLFGYHSDDRPVGVVALGGPAAMSAAARHRALLLRQPARTAAPGLTA
jgi:3-phenylpropionate/trans-cinnamate dioxygenase ferredoxin reductase subunit